MQQRGHVIKMDESATTLSSLIRPFQSRDLSAAYEIVPLGYWAIELPTISLYSLLYERYKKISYFI